MIVSDVMTRGVTTVAPTDPLRKVAQVMLQYEVSGLPVIEGGRLVGIISEGDFLRRIETGTERHRPRWLEWLISPGQLAGEFAHAEGRTVDEVMTRDVATIGPDAPLEQAVSLMESRKVKRLPVVQGDALVGILSRANLVHAFIVGSKRLDREPGSDTAIRQRLTAELKRPSWAPGGAIDFAVENGIVDLQGVISDERQRAALRVLAENIPGVIEVRDHLLEVNSSEIMPL